MPDCECMHICQFFRGKIQKENGLGALFWKTYCHGNKTHCARYIMIQALGGEKVPVSLFPNMEAYAHKLIKEKF